MSARHRAVLVAHCNKVPDVVQVEIALEHTVFAKYKYHKDAQQAQCCVD